MSSVKKRFQNQPMYTLRDAKRDEMIRAYPVVTGNHWM